MIEWHPATGGEVLHAVQKSEFYVNRNSLCFKLCELPPYPKHIQIRLDRRGGNWSRCSQCMKKLKAKNLLNSSCNPCTY